MSNFQTAVHDLIYRDELGFVNDPDDPGGATKYGVSLRTYRRLIDPNATVQTIRNLTYNDAVSFYEIFFWGPHGSAMRALSSLPPRLAYVLFNAGVNIGRTRAHVLLQKTLRSHEEDVVIDGVLGPRTVRACYRHDEDSLIREFAARLCVHYHTIMTKNPTLQKFKLGWFRRAVRLAAGGQTP